MDQVLDAASGGSSASEHLRSICIDGNAPSVCVAAPTPAAHAPVVVQGQRPTTLLTREDTPRRSNGHAQSEDAACSGAKFELRAFQEERRPAKLFSPGHEQHVRVTRRRPTEEARGCVPLNLVHCGWFFPSFFFWFAPPVRFRSWSVSGRS